MINTLRFYFKEISIIANLLLENAEDAGKKKNILDIEKETKFQIRELINSLKKVDDLQKLYENSYGETLEELAAKREIEFSEKARLEFVTGQKIMFEVCGIRM